jgi:hypothetical protein
MQLIFLTSDSLEDKSEIHLTNKINGRLPKRYRQDVHDVVARHSLNTSASNCVCIYMVHFLLRKEMSSEAVYEPLSAWKLVVKWLLQTGEGHI